MRRLVSLARIVVVVAAVGLSGCAVDFGVESGEDELYSDEAVDEEDPLAEPEASGEASAEGAVDKADDPHGSSGGGAPSGANPTGVEEVPSCAPTSDRALCPLAPKSGTMSHGDPIPWKESDNK